jgi:hypothetical protein
MRRYAEAASSHTMKQSPVELVQSSHQTEGRHSLSAPGVFGERLPSQCLRKVSDKLASPGLECDVGAEPDLPFPLYHQSIQKVSNHTTMSEVRTLDLGVGAAPYRVIPHILEFRLESET